MTATLVVPKQVMLDGFIVSSINDPSALSFWVKLKAHGVDRVRLPDLRVKAKPWGFAISRFNSAISVLKKLGLVEIQTGAVNRKWVVVK